ncbi:MAG: formate dehydrogenase accessory protein FdhE [Chloroflexi bacterium]|nr:MAG: formate dehydrogenase accessory protein FdhE [Chloroflexota bacterium]
MSVTAAATAAASDVWAERRRRVRELRSRQGFARQLLDFYGALLGVQQTAFDGAAAARPAADKLAGYVAELVVPSVIDLSLAAGPDRMRHELIHRLESESPQAIVQAWIDGQDQSAVDRFLARAALGPVLEALGPQARAACAGPRDALHCPDCGGPPQLSYSAPGPEDLATGPRRLLCARCGASWGLARMTCPACGEDRSAKLSIFSEQGTMSGEHGSVVRGLQRGVPPNDQGAIFPHLRIEACESCRHYLLSIDLAANPRAVAVVDELAAIPLGLYARDRGFTKITPNLMGF